MGILRRRKREFTLSRAGIKHRSLLEQPDVYFYGVLQYRVNGKFKDCLALLRPSCLSLRDRKHIERIVATVRLDRGITFHSGQQPDTESNGKTTPAVSTQARMVKFELHVSTGHGQAGELEETCQAKYEFKCKSSGCRDLWKAYILAASSGIRPIDCDVHLLPGQIMQVERMLEMENKRQLSQRSFAPTQRLSSVASDPRNRSHPEKVLAHKSKSYHSPAPVQAHGHKFYKDGTKGRPSYFFENISREMAEAILTIGHMYGNLLMRRSTSYPNSYAISFRSTFNRNTEIFHYEVGPIRKHNSIDLYFEIKMEGRISRHGGFASSRGGEKYQPNVLMTRHHLSMLPKQRDVHPKFKCLNDVIKYFIRLTDGVAHCFTINDLDKLGIKQPPYSTHYAPEPPTDYDDKDLPSPPPPSSSSSARSALSAPTPRSKEQSHGDDPNSEEITESLPAEEDENDKIVQFLEPISRIMEGISAPIQERPASEVAVPARKHHIVTPAEQFLHRRASFAAPAEFGRKTDHIPAAQQFSAISGIKSHPPPPPPPLPTADYLRPRPLVPLKPALKPPQCRKQFAPEKNLFRIALEYVETPEVEVVKDPKELADQLKGNVKSRVADLEPDPAKKVAPNFSRPPRKDFMGELAEKLKIRRQVVEQTCW